MKIQSHFQLFTSNNLNKLIEWSFFTFLLMEMSLNWKLFMSSFLLFQYLYEHPYDANMMRMEKTCKLKKYFSRDFSYGTIMNETECIWKIFWCHIKTRRRGQKHYKNSLNRCESCSWKANCCCCLCCCFSEFSHYHWSACVVMLWRGLKWWYWRGLSRKSNWAEFRLYSEQ